jgi:polyisoprenoid-binding protein YceI
LRNKKLITTLLIAGPIAAFAAVYLLFFTPKTPPPVTLEDAPQTPAGDVGDPVGLWTLQQGSEAGYRVREKLARLPAQSDAVGRTEAVTGQMTIERQANGLVARDIRVEVDTTKLRSDEARRDRALRERGLQTDRYPRALFVSTGPVPIPMEAQNGSEVQLNLPGELTIHGVRRTVSIPIQARLRNGRLEVAGAVEFAMNDFGIVPPSVANIVTVEPRGTMEFQLFMAKSRAA